MTDGPGMLSLNSRMRLGEQREGAEERRLQNTR